MAEQRIERAGRDRNVEDVVKERTEQVLLDIAHRGRGNGDGVGHAVQPKNGV